MRGRPCLLERQRRVTGWTRSTLTSSRVHRLFCSSDSATEATDGGYSGKTQRRAMSSLSSTRRRKGLCNFEGICADHGHTRSSAAAEGDLKSSSCKPVRGAFPHQSYSYAKRSALSSLQSCSWHSQKMSFRPNWMSRALPDPSTGFV